MLPLVRNVQNVCGDVVSLDELCLQAMSNPGGVGIEILKTPPACPARAQEMIIASHSNLSVVTSPTSGTPSHPLSALSAALAHTTRRISGITSLLARITHTHNY
jgi:hypothetical protein